VSSEAEHRAEQETGRGKEPPRKKQGKRASLASGLGYGGFSFVLNGTFALVSSVVIARLYGIDVVGEFALVSAPTAVIWALSTVREQVAFVREISTLEPRSPKITGLFWAVFAFSSALTIAVAAIVGVGVEILYRGPIGHPELIAPAIGSLCGYVVVTNTIWNVDMVFSAFRAGRELNAVRLHQAVLFVVLTMIGAQISATVWMLVATTLLAQASSLVHRLFYLPRYMALRAPQEEVSAGFAQLPEFIKFGIRIAPGDLAVGVTNDIGIWALSLTGGVQALGAYSRAWSISSRLVELNYRITEMLFPALVERDQRSDRAGYERALINTLRFSSIVLLLPAAVGGGAAHGVMAIYGPGFEQGSDALAISLLVPALATLGSICRQPLLVVNRPLAASMCTIVGMVVTAATTFPLVSGIGITGAALGIVLGGFASVALAAHLSEPKISNRNWPLLSRLALLGSYGVGFGVARLIDGTSADGVRLIVALVAGTAAYVGGLLAFGALTPEDRGRIRNVVSRVRGRIRAQPRGATASS
jgi:O-antigen/teichoic acid export membrane protein